MGLVTAVIEEYMVYRNNYWLWYENCLLLYMGYNNVAERLNLVSAVSFGEDRSQVLVHQLLKGSLTSLSTFFNLYLQQSK